ncbi:unnamed protein product [Adineta steineri]|uniref:Transposase domain-containing protein n=1 Tax=Adineta steineri TaxID=433720 RepID=A0A815FX94_9BILA|nr:unnamed protein product [Adineta steineri]
MSSDYENVYRHHFLSQLTNFIHFARLNKTATTSLLSLLKTTKSFSANIPKTTNALWEQVGVKFTFKTFYYCSSCFEELNSYQDLYIRCNSKEKANSEFCLFSLAEELERVVKSATDIIEWYSTPKNQLAGDVIKGTWYQQHSTNVPCLSLMLSTDGKPIIKSKTTQTSIWPVISYLVEIPPPLREDINNTLLLGLWHGPIAPSSSVLLNKIVRNIQLLMTTGINININNKMNHFIVKVQLFSGDFPARAKCNQLVNHNGYYACKKCLFKGSRCPAPCTKHTLYKWIDFIRRPQQQRTQQHINTCARQISTTNHNVFGVIGQSPLSSILSIPDQSTFDYFHLVLEIHLRYLLSKWNDVLKNNTTALTFINECLDEIKYPHTFNRRPRDFSSYGKWKAAELRLFIIYDAFVYDPCKELYSVHALVHLWEQVEQHGELAYHSLFASESCLHEFEKLAYDSTLLCEQISFWWCIFRQVRSKEVRYLAKSLNDEQLIVDNFFDDHSLKNYRQEFDLVFNQMFSQFPDLSFKYYSRYQYGLLVYHSMSYSRRKNSNSYTVCVVDESNPVELLLYYGQILFFFYVYDKPYLFLKRYVNSKNMFSSLMKPIEEVADWNIYVDRYYRVVRHSAFELVIVPCSTIVSKCIFFQLDSEFCICTQIELETEHD